MLASEVAFHAEEREGVEARNQYLAFGADDAVDLAQELMRLVGELERMGQHDEINAVLGEWQPVWIGQHLRGVLEIDGEASRDSGAKQERAFGQPDLQRVEAEDVGERGIEVSLLTRAAVAA